MYSNIPSLNLSSEESIPKSFFIPKQNKSGFVLQPILLHFRKKWYLDKTFYANVTQIKLTKSVQIWGSSDAGDCYCYQIKQGVFFSIMILFRLWRRVFFTEKWVSPVQEVPGPVRLWGGQWGRALIRGGRRDRDPGRGDRGRELDGGAPGVWPGQARSLPQLLRPHPDWLTITPVTWRRVALLCHEVQESWQRHTSHITQVTLVSPGPEEIVKVWSQAGAALSTWPRHSSPAMNVSPPRLPPSPHITQSTSENI